MTRSLRHHWPLLRRIAVLLAVVVIVACSWLGPLDTAANEEVDAGLKRALVSFASARALNAVISLAQGTEIAFQPAGVGINLAVGQILDPVNDLVEQFSNLMLAASVAFGVQKVVLAMGAHWLVSLLVTLAAGAWAILHFRRGDRPAWLFRLVVLLLMVRFAIPVVTIGSDLVFQQFLAKDYLASQQTLAATASRIEGIAPAPPAAVENPGILDKLKDWMGIQSAAWKGRFENLKQAAEQAVEHIIKLIVIFLLQTLIVPTGLLWALWSFARYSLRPRPSGSEGRSP